MTIDPGCHEFRAHLARALEGLPVPAELQTLSWHEHLLGCGACRELLEQEEALEVLLATLPEPKLPPELKRRLVACLTHASSEEVAATSLASADRGLDDLLDAAGAPVPAGLGERVRRGLRAELALDALLEVDTGVEVPSDLGRRVLRGLEAERGQRARRRFALPTYAAAAAVLLMALGVSLWSEPPAEEAQPRAVVVAEAEDPDPSMLAVLDLIEDDRLWRDYEASVEPAEAEGDLHLLLCDSLEPGDELLLSFIDVDDSETVNPAGG